MNAKPYVSKRRAMLTFLLALAGSVTGILAGPRLVAAAAGAPVWLLPLVLVVSVALALLAAYAGIRLATSKAGHGSSSTGGET